MAAATAWKTLSQPTCAQRGSVSAFDGTSATSPSFSHFVGRSFSRPESARRGNMEPIARKKLSGVAHGPDRMRMPAGRSYATCTDRERLPCTPASFKRRAAAALIASAGFRSRYWVFSCSAWSSRRAAPFSSASRTSAERAREAGCQRGCENGRGSEKRSTGP